ncbi:unnamed protein product, partial [Mesorhabditis belari]|uniref:Uncharacterized protein n=1 Tax=Mesorhabditis belari TaxID=2138241 RepID=A0AAF3FBZ4_9BILA
MAELKSITGDAPYTGGGNAPAILPQPMGFWGRPQYYGGGGFSGGMMGGWHPGMGWLNGDGGRFTSSSGGPYGVNSWPYPFN